MSDILPKLNGKRRKQKNNSTKLARPSPHPLALELGGAADKGLCGEILLSWRAEGSFVFQQDTRQDVLQLSFLGYRYWNTHNWKVK